MQMAAATGAHGALPLMDSSRPATDHDYKLQKPLPVVVALIPLTSRTGPALLGIVRGIEPGIGGLALPGGYVDEMESFEMACAREVQEECGITTSAPDWELVCSRISPNNRVLVFCRLKQGPWGAPAVVGDIDLPVSEEVRGLAAIYMESELVFSTHQEVARAFLERRQRELRLVNGDDTPF